MSEVLSIADIEGLYPNEWILVEDPITNDALEVQSGKVLWHSANRDDVYRKALESRPRNFAMLCTRTMPPNTAIIL
jgi:hypothetical protein